MASNYTGNPTAVEAPASAPGIGVTPIISLPADTDGATWTNLYQAFKTLADYTAYLTQVVSGTGKDLFIRDDFAGGAFSAGLWGSSIDASFTCIEQTDACGAMQGTLTTSATKVLTTSRLNLGTYDFMFSALVKMPSIGGAGSGVNVGLINSGDSTKDVAFEYTTSSPSWFTIDNVGGTVNTGVAVATASYQLLQFKRVSGVLSFSIDGVQVSSHALPDSIYSAIQFNVIRATSGTTTALCDYVSLWAKARG